MARAKTRTALPHCSLHSCAKIRTTLPHCVLVTFFIVLDRFWMGLAFSKRFWMGFNKYGPFRIQTYPKGFEKKTHPKPIEKPI